MRYSVAIVGAGIGGLASACLLARKGHSVQLFERFTAAKPVGSGLVIQPVGQQVLSEIGVFDAALAYGAQIRAMQGHEANTGRKVLAADYGAGFGLAVHRASLFQLLHDAALNAGAKLETGHDVKGFERGSVLTDLGAFGPYDLIINASGANSALSPVRTRALPYGAIWGTVPWPEQTDLPKDMLLQRYRRANRMVGILPVGRKPEDATSLATIFWSIRPEDHPRWRSISLDDWKAEAEGLWPDIGPFLQEITAHEQMILATYKHGALLQPVRGRVLHLGDAAHRTSPQLGQGANMALLDALALERAMRDPDLDIAMLNYRRARRAHVWFYQLLSAAFTPQYQSDSTVLPWVRDHVLFPLSQVPPVPRILRRLVSGNMLPPLGSLR